MNPNFLQWRSLKTRLTLFALLTFLIGTWSLAWYASRMLHGDMERMIGEQQFSTVSFIAQEINQELDDRVKALQRFAEKITPASMSKPALLQAMLEDQPTFHLLFNNGVAAAGTDGTVIAEYPPLPGRLGANFKERDYVIGPLKEGKVTIGRPVMSKLMHAPAFVIGVPVRDAQGKIIGTLGGVVDLRLPNFLDKVITGSYGKTGGYLLVAPQYRLVVTASDKRRIMEVLPAPGVNPAIDRFIQGYEGSEILVNPLGVEVLTSIKRVPAAGWYVAVTVPTEEVFAPIHDMLFRVRLAAAFFTLVFAGLIWWILRRQLAPMLSALKALSTLSDTGEAPQPLPVTTRDEIGDLIGGFNRLLGNLRQREEALRESEARFRDLTEMSSDFYWETDAEHRLTLRTESKREAAEAVSVTAAAIGQRRWEAPYLAPDESGWQQHRATLDAHLPFRDFEIARPRPNGTVHHVSVSGNPVFDASGVFKGYRGVGADITERKRAEAEIRLAYAELERRVEQRTQELQAANRELESFSYSVSHDLRAPLRAIEGFSRLIESEYSAQFDARAKDYFRRIRGGAIRMATLIDDMLKLSRVSRQEIRLGPVDLSELAQQAADDLQGAEPERKVEWVIAQEIRAHGDAGLLQVAMQNLIGNAWKYSARREPARIEFGIEERDGAPAYFVRDNGVGFDMAYADKLFGAFQRLHSPGEFPGTGIGLATVKRIVLRHGGKVGAQSRPDVGATFYFTL